MKVRPERFSKVTEIFPDIPAILAKLNSGGIQYLIGGSVSLYLQGNSRLPHDVDLMFAADDHEAANKLFDIQMQYIVRPAVTMKKSTPIESKYIDFLSCYTVNSHGANFISPPKESVEMTYKGHIYSLVPAEKIAFFKLISQRLQHNDIDDVKHLLDDPSFNSQLFWLIVQSLDAVEIINNLADRYHISIPAK